MTTKPDESRDERAIDAGLIEARQREMAVEHLLFKTIEYVEAKQPGLVETLDASLDHLWDHASDGTQDHAAVRRIAKRMIDGAAGGRS